MQENVSVPLPNLHCPLCGLPNGCVPAACGRFDVDCWCRHVEVDAVQRAKVPEAERGRACLCARCAAPGAE